MAKKKNMGKVKRYNHSFYSNGRAVRRLLVSVLLVVIVACLGYFVAPYVIDFGTSSWYSIAGSIEKFFSGMSTEAPSSSDEEPIATETPTPTATPEAIQTLSITEGTWQSVNLSALTSDELIAQTVESMQAQGVTYVVITLKDTSGYIHYNSSVALAANSIAATTVDAAQIAAAFKTAGITPVVELTAFRDPVAVYTDRSIGIQYLGTDYMWLDNTAEAGGKAWMNPYSADAVDFIGDLIEELQGFGFEHVVLSAVQFPSQVSSSQYFGDVGDATRADAIAVAMSAWNDRFDGEMILWYEYGIAVCAEGNTLIGGALPSTLGAENILLEIPLADEDETPTTQDEIDAAVAALKAQGAQYVVVSENTGNYFA